VRNDNYLFEVALNEMKMEIPFLKKLLSSPQKIGELKQKMIKLLNKGDINKFENISKRVSPNLIDKVENTIKKIGKDYDQQKIFFSKYFTTKFKLPANLSSIVAIPFAYIVSISENGNRERNKIIGEISKKSITTSTEGDINILMKVVGFLIKFALSYEIVSFIPLISMSGSILSMMLVVVVFLTITKIIDALKEEFRYI